MSKFILKGINAAKSLLLLLDHFWIVFRAFKSGSKPLLNVVQISMCKQIIFKIVNFGV